MLLAKTGSLALHGQRELRKSISEIMYIRNDICLQGFFLGKKTSQSLCRASGKSPNPGEPGIVLLFVLAPYQQLDSVFDGIYMPFELVEVGFDILDT